MILKNVNVNKKYVLIFALSLLSLTDVLGFVERLGDVASEDSVHSADDDEHDRIAKRDHIGGVHVGGADKQVVLPGGEMVDSTRWADHRPHTIYQHLQTVPHGRHLHLKLNTQ